MIHATGRFQAAESPAALARLHLHDGTTPLVEVDHEPKIAVLDQEDLDTQGIDVSQFIAGASKGIKELGSCTANTAVEALSNVLTPEAFALFIATLGAQSAPASVYTDVVAAERAAIGFYAKCTHQTGVASDEWPPTDCGSSGPYIVSELQNLGVVKTERIAHGADSIVSLMQTDGVMIGSPWLNAWFEPNTAGFIDGDGSAATLKAQIASGIAGGHEFYGSAIEKLVLLRTGLVDAAKTVLRIRNHWDPTWADHGSARVHLSTIVALGNQVDVRQLVA